MRPFQNFSLDFCWRQNMPGETETLFLDMFLVLSLIYWQLVIDFLQKLFYNVDLIFGNFEKLEFVKIVLLQCTALAWRSKNVFGLFQRMVSTVIVLHGEIIKMIYVSCDDFGGKTNQNHLPYW